jgi:hypothetical protein
MPNAPSAREIYAICAAGCLDERSVRRAYAEPLSVRSSTLARVREAAQALGVPPPALVGQREDFAGAPSMPLAMASTRGPRT